MFEGCTSLTTVPDFPNNTQLNYNDCEYMFKGCTSLTTAPKLASNTFNEYYYNGIYSEMFEGCTSLNSVTCLYELPEYIDSYTFYNWLYNTASTGTLKVASSQKAKWDELIEEAEQRNHQILPAGWTIITE
jgi:hypothetical protein